MSGDGSDRFFFEDDLALAVNTAVDDDIVADHDELPCLRSLVSAHQIEGNDTKRAGGNILEDEKSDFVGIAAAGNPFEAIGPGNEVVDSGSSDGRRNVGAVDLEHATHHRARTRIDDDVDRRQDSGTLEVARSQPRRDTGNGFHAERAYDDVRRHVASAAIRFGQSPVRGVDFAGDEHASTRHGISGEIGHDAGDAAPTPHDEIDDEPFTMIANSRRALLEPSRGWIQRLNDERSPVRAAYPIELIRAIGTGELAREPEGRDARAVPVDHLGTFDGSALCVENSSAHDTPHRVGWHDARAQRHRLREHGSAGAIEEPGHGEVARDEIACRLPEKEKDETTGKLRARGEHVVGVDLVARHQVRLVRTELAIEKKRHSAAERVGSGKRFRSNHGRGKKRGPARFENLLRGSVDALLEDPVAVSIDGHHETRARREQVERHFSNVTGANAQPGKRVEPDRPIRAREAYRKIQIAGRRCRPSHFVAIGAQCGDERRAVSRLDRVGNRKKSSVLQIGAGRTGNAKSSAVGIAHFPGDGGGQRRVTHTHEKVRRSRSQTRGEPSVK